MKKLDFKDIKFPTKIRDTHKTEKTSCISISVLGYQNREKFPIYVSKNIFKTSRFTIDRKRSTFPKCFYQRF